MDRESLNHTAVLWVAVAGFAGAGVGYSLGYAGELTGSGVAALGLLVMAVLFAAAFDGDVGGTTDGL